MVALGAWRRWGRYATAAAAAGLISWFAFVAHREVPLLDGFDLAVHETGHLVMGFAPRMIMFIAGSASQVLVPLGLAWYFGIRRGDAAGGGFCLAWAGTSAWDVSVYIADAPVQALPLIGGGQHDWAYLLGPQGWGVMDRAGEIAGFVEFTGAVLAGVGILVAVWAWVLGVRTTPARLSPALEPTTTVHDPWLEAARLPFHHEEPDSPADAA